MKRLLAVFLLLAACDKVVESELIETRQETGRAQCSHPGFCFSCMPGMGFGKKGSGMSCGMKFSAFCSGSEPANFEVKVYKIRRESGKREIVASRSVTEVTGACR